MSEITEKKHTRTERKKERKNERNYEQINKNKSKPLKKCLVAFEPAMINNIALIKEFTVNIFTEYKCKQTRFAYKTENLVKPRTTYEHSHSHSQIEHTCELNWQLSKQQQQRNYI